MSGRDERDVVGMNSQSVESFPVTPDEQVDPPVDGTFDDAVVGRADEQVTVGPGSDRPVGTKLAWGQFQD